MLTCVAAIFENSHDVVSIVLFTSWIPVAIVAIIADACVKASRYKARERSRQEIAAYIAEGSMTPAEGERLLNAGPKIVSWGRWGCGNKS